MRLASHRLGGALSDSFRNARQPLLRQVCLLVILIGTGNVRVSRITQVDGHHTALRE
jgi:hypothetical protein